MSFHSLKNIADQAGVSLEQAELAWNKAEDIITKKYGAEHLGFYDMVTSLTKKLLGLKEEKITFKQFMLFEMGLFNKRVKVIDAPTGSDMQFANKIGTVKNISSDHKLYFIDFGDNDPVWIKVENIEKIS